MVRLAPGEHVTELVGDESRQFTGYRPVINRLEHTHIGGDGIPRQPLPALMEQVTLIRLQPQGRDAGHGQPLATESHHRPQHAAAYMSGAVLPVHFKFSDHRTHKFV